VKKVALLFLAVVVFAIPVGIEIATNPNTEGIIKETKAELAVARINAADRKKATKIRQAQCNAKRG
jgi:hypothetical protein